MMMFGKKRGSHDITDPDSLPVDRLPASTLNNSLLTHRTRAMTAASIADSGIVNIAMDHDHADLSDNISMSHRPHDHEAAALTRQHSQEDRPHSNLCPSLQSAVLAVAAGSDLHNNVNLLNPAILNKQQLQLQQISIPRPGVGGGNGNELHSLEHDPVPRSGISSLSGGAGSGGVGGGSALQLVWQDVSFRVKSDNWSWPQESVFPVRKLVHKQILETQSGQVTTGQLVGIIGPSGAGKSTLLNCLTGRYRASHGLTGSVFVTTTTTAVTAAPAAVAADGDLQHAMTAAAAGNGDAPSSLINPDLIPVRESSAVIGNGISMRKKLINVAFIPQRDNLFMNFTVKETLIFASRMKNTASGSDTYNNPIKGRVAGEEGDGGGGRSFFDHEKEALKVMRYLNLESCAKTRISRCSGGQVKRVCIGVELISRPEILVLDEPTTGLDSSTAFQCVSILKKLAEYRVNPPAVLATIHQPSAKILMKFNLIYLLSQSGHCLYFGPPDQIKNYFVSAGLEYPLDYNPADFAIETAYGDYGEQVFDKLTAITRHSTANMLMSSNKNNKNSNHHRSINNNNEIRNNRERQEWREAEKIKITSIIKGMEARPYSFASHVYLLLIRNWIKIYRDSGQLYLRVFQNIVIGLMVSFLWNPDIGHEDGCWSDFLDSGTKASNATDAKMQYLNKITRINSNSALLFAFLIYVIMVSVMSTVLSFPSETLVIVKEMKNNWYSCASYFWSKTIAEIPILCLMILILSVIIYPLTGQIPILWRFLILYLVSCLMGEVCQSIGMLFGTIFSDDLISACFSSVASGFPPILFGGFVVQFQHIRWYLKPFAYLSYLKYAFESAVIAIYGFDRCTRKVSYSAAENIAKARNPVELIGTLVSSFNLTAKDAQAFSLLLNVETACVEGVINGTIDYFGINRDSGGGGDGDYMDDYDEGGMTTESSVRAYTLAPSRTQLERNAQKEEASYVLSYFGLKDDLLIGNICALVMFVVVLKIATYAVLRNKSRT